MQSPIYIDCIKLVFDDYTEPQLVPNFFPQVYVRELNNRLVSDTNDGGLKNARDEDNNIITIYSTLSSLFLPQLKEMSARYKVMCDCECFTSDKGIHSSLLSWSDSYLKKLKDQI